MQPLARGTFLQRLRHQRGRRGQTVENCQLNVRLTLSNFFFWIHCANMGVYSIPFFGCL